MSAHELTAPAPGRPAAPDGAEPRERAPRTTALVLVHHAVTTTPGRRIAPFAVTPRVFGDQLDALLDAGYRCLTLTDLVAALAAAPDTAAGHSTEDPPQRLAAITVDDGYADFAEHALPALSARSLPSTLYVTTGWLSGGAPGTRREPGPEDAVLDWSQLPELAAAGVEVGAHSHSHPQLDTLATAAVREELLRPKHLLEDALGTPVPSFAYPHGYSGPRVRRLARAAGYDTAVGVRNALTPADDDRFGLARLMVAADTSPERFADWLAARDTPVATTGESWRTRGWRAYRRTRALVRRAPGSDYR